MLRHTWRIRFVAPDSPTGTLGACKKFDVSTWATSFDDFVEFIGLAGMLSLPRDNDVGLSASGCQRPIVFPTNAEQNDLGDVTEIEPDAAPIRATVLPHFVPDDVALIGEAPAAHDLQSLCNEGVRHPQLQVGLRGCDLRYGSSTKSALMSLNSNLDRQNEGVPSLAKPEVVDEF